MHPACCSAGDLSRNAVKMDPFLPAKLPSSLPASGWPEEPQFAYVLEGAWEHEPVTFEGVDFCVNNFGNGSVVSFVKSLFTSLLAVSVPGVSECVALSGVST